MLAVGDVWSNQGGQERGTGAALGFVKTSLTDLSVNKKKKMILRQKRRTVCFRGGVSPITVEV